MLNQKQQKQQTTGLEEALNREFSITIPHEAFHVIRVIIALPFPGFLLSVFAYLVDRP
jgi:hypothetical protein